ncbi:MAG: tetratricopeptide repeat protein [Promethearchaeota archaeon]|nr:MAG: tetratricopeptide repeat protein [Candidatus Lokiarchaeota archaeon]
MKMQTKIRFLKPLNDFNLREFIEKEKSLTFLVGAGVSREPPSSIASSREIKEAIVKFAIPEEQQPDIFSIKELRFERLIQTFQAKIDTKLNFLKYFESFKDFNIIHKFLAEMISKKNIVMTTNFDNLIEYAVGSEKPELQVIITNKDYKTYGNPNKVLKKKILPVYKLHGCLKNIKTGENTEDSIILTLQSLGKQMSGTLYSMGNLKEEFMNLACKDRTLIVLGYSGRDDFDIIPTILRIKTIDKLIWISHRPDLKEKSVIYRVDSAVKLNFKSLNKLSEEDLIIYKINKILGIEVLKIEAYTLNLISKCMNLNHKQYMDVKTTEKQSFFDWLKNNLVIPTEAQKYMFAAKLLMDHNYISKSLISFKKARDQYKRLDDAKGLAYSLHGLGSAYTYRLEDKKAEYYYHEAYKIFKDLGDETHQIFILNSFGNLYNEIKKPLKALKYYEYVLKYYEKEDNKEELALAFHNIGVVHERIGDMNNDKKEYLMAIDYFQKAYHIFEEFGELSRMAHNLYSIALELDRLLDYKKAISTAERSYELFKKCGHLQGQILASYDLGRLNYDIKNLNKVKKWFNKAIEACIMKRDKIQYPQLLIKIGRIIRRFDVPMAISIYKKADKWVKNNKDELGIGMIGNELGELYLNQGKFNEARKYFLRALKLAKKRNDQISIPELQAKIQATKMKVKLPIVK